MHRALTYFGHCSSLGSKPHETQNPVPGLALENKIISSFGFGLENYAWFLRASWVGKLHLVLESFLSWKTTLGSWELPCQVNIQYLQVDEASALTMTNDLRDLYSNTLKCTQVQGLQFGTAYENSGHVDQFSIHYEIKLESQVPDWMGAKLLLTSCSIQIMLWCQPVQHPDKNKNRYYGGLTACQADSREEVHQLLQFCKEFQNQLWFSSMTLIKKWRVWENGDQG